jgi:AraC family transcriptional regulator, positive regulator of tynA and feaB
MKTAFSTNSVHARDRLAYWREVASKAYLAHDFSTRVGRGFHGEIRVATLGSVDLAAFECDECLVERTQQRLAGANDDDVLLCRQVVGHTSVYQDGRDATTAPGDVFLLDPRRPFALAVGPNCRSVVFKVPRWEVQARLGEIASYTATMLPQAAPVTALASEFLGMIAVRADAIDPAMGPKVAQQALDLVALAFETGVGAPVQLSSTRTTTLLRLKSIIETRLHDPALKPAGVAAAAGISVRYANALLAHEGTSLERFIMLRRLQHCRQALEDPLQLGRTAGDIAYSHGFSDLSHFTRRYKAQFGRSPGESRPELRARAL